MDLRIRERRSRPAARTVLRDGTPVCLRPLDLDDAVAVAAFFSALSPDGRRMRFFSPVSEMGSSAIRYLVDVDQVDHLAWGAFVGDRCVGEVRCVRLRTDPTAGEIAFAVADEIRRVGLARRLIETIGVAAGTVGIETFTASVLSDNRASGALLSSVGMQFRFEDGARSGTGPVPPWTGPDALADQIRLLQRCAASSVQTAAAVA
jgi:RimJ/RimL family protein N-acetyltransferase